MSVTTVTKDFATYTIEEFQGHVEVEIKYTTNISTYEGFRVFDTAVDAHVFIVKNEKLCKVMSILSKHTQEMEGYSYYGSNPGISEDDYDSVAEDLIAAFEL